MRGTWPTSFLFVALTSGCWGAGPVSPDTERPVPAEAPPGAAPAWVPALTAAQKALLKPVDRPLKVRAERVFPDLTRFGYMPSRPLGSADDALRYTRLVAQVLRDSPRFYTLEEAPASAANLVAQYGPAGEEPDGFMVVTRGEEEGLVGMAPAAGAEEARAAIASAQKQAGGSLAALRIAALATPGVPAVRTALAEALRGAGRMGEAEAAFKEAVRVDPTFAPAQLGLAELAEQRGDLATARQAALEALAYHPAGKRALELLQRLGSGGSTSGGWTDAPAPVAPAASSGRVAPPVVFLDVDQAGAVHVATGKSDAAQMYGGCRAVMRHEPDVRAQIFQQARETPYHLSMAEEVVCLEAALGAYQAAKQGGEPPSREYDELFRIAGEDGLSGYVMFEILGQHRPERARGALPQTHRDIVAYIEKHVLGGARVAPAAPPAGVFTRGPAGADGLYTAAWGKGDASR
jgi:tetratricopeptide (TPR) repeat protein